MTQPPATEDPVDVCLDDLAMALACRPGVPEERRDAVAHAVKKLVHSFLPQDTLQLMVAGQAVLFNALTADAVREILDGMPVALRPRARSNAVAMGRIVAKHLDSLIRPRGLLKRAAAKEKSPIAEVPGPAETLPAAVAAPFAEATPWVRPGRGSRRTKKLLAYKAVAMLRAAAAPALAGKVSRKPINSHRGHAVPARINPSTTMAPSSGARP